MRPRSHLASRVPIDMTPMIDIVFQLLIFFVLTLQIVPAEGQFEMQMPRQTAGGKFGSSEVPPLIVTLQSDADGGLAEISLGGESFTDLEALHVRIERLVAENPHLTTQGRVELRCDPDLAYQHAIAGVGAISASRLEGGAIVRLFEQVRFVANE